MSTNRTTPTIHALLIGLGLVFAATPLLALQSHGQEHGGHGDGAAAEKGEHEFAGDPYLLPTDPVSGEKLGSVKTQVVFSHEGRELRFAGEETASIFKAGPAQYLPGVDEALVRLQLPFYPLETCPISGKELGGMGEPIDLVFKNRLVRLCCKGCKSTFAKQPGKYIAQVDEAVIAAQMAHYPTTSCLVSVEELGEDGAEIIDHVVGNRLFRLCCPPCRKSIAKNPLPYLAQLDQALQGSEHADEGGAHGHGEHGH